MFDSLEQLLPDSPVGTRTEQGLAVLITLSLSLFWAYVYFANEKLCNPRMAFQQHFNRD